MRNNLMKMQQAVFIIWLCAAITVVPAKLIPGDGSKFQVNGLFPINADGNINYQSGVMMAEAMRYAVQKVNQNSSYLPGYKLEIVQMYDVLKEEPVRKKVLQTFIRRVPFLIGPHTSELSYVTRFLTSTFKIIAFSYGATFSDFDKFGYKKETMVRTVPSDVFRIRAALDLMQNMEWKYISVVSSYGYNGERDALHFIANLSSIDACIADQIDLPRTPTMKDYTEAVKILKSDDKINAAVFFTTKKDFKNVISAMNDLNVTDKIYVLCMYGCTNYVEVVKGIEHISTNVLSLDLHCPEIPGFKNYFLNLKPKPSHGSHFLKFWQSVFDCSFNPNSTRKCTGKEQLSEGKGYYPLTPVHTVINAVDILARALTHLIDRVCQSRYKWMENQTTCVIKPEQRALYNMRTLKNIQRLFLFPDGTTKMGNLNQDKVQYDVHKLQYQAGKYVNIPIASWVTDRTSRGSLSIHKTWYSSERLHKPDVFCSEPCKPGHIRDRDSNPTKQLCCWRCVACPPNNIVVDDTCVQCAITEMADIKENNCNALPIKIPNLKNKNVLPVIFTLVSLAGMICVLVVVVFFIKYNQIRLVRASGRDLSYMILCGIFLIFTCPLLFLRIPTITTCVFRNAIPGIAFLACYAPLFLKTNRIYRIFCHAKISVKRPSLVSSRSLLLLAFGIVTVQILLVGVWFISKVPSPVAKVSKDSMYITFHCKGDSSPILLLLNVALSVFFMISCTVLAFKTRHFPKYYNEAKFIGITLYITCVAWSIFLPAYFLIPESDFVREYFMSAICVIIGYITLFGLFGHKIRLLVYQDKLTNENGNFPTWYLSYSSDCKDNADGMIAHPEHNANSDETIA